MMSGVKDWEGKSTRTTAIYLVYCTCLNSPRVPKWDQGTCLEGGFAYVVACVAGFRSPGIEGYKVDWLLENVVSLADPVALPSGVGRHPPGWIFWVCGAPTIHLSRSTEAGALIAYTIN